MNVAKLLNNGINRIARLCLSKENYEIYTYKYGELSFLKKRHPERYYIPFRKRWPWNYEKKYYIVRNSADTGTGIFSYAKHYIFDAEWAESNGYVPLADIEMENDFSAKRIGTYNEWSIFFEQPQLKDVIGNRKNRIYCGYLNGHKFKEEMCCDINKDKCCNTIRCVENSWREYYTNIKHYVDKWLVVNELLFDDEYKRMISQMEGNNVLGVFIRDAFHKDLNDKYSAIKAREVFSKHPLSDYIINEICIVERKYKEWNCNKVVLFTMCTETEALFDLKFGKDLIVYNRDRQSYSELADYVNNSYENKIGNNKYKTKDEYLRTIEMDSVYIQEVIALSKCDYFIGTKASGTAMALAFNGGQYKDILLFDDDNKIDRY